MGIKTGYFYHSKNYVSTVRYYYKGLMAGFLVFLVYALMAFYSLEILTLLKIEHFIACATSRLIKKCVPFVFFQFLNQINENFLSSQDISKPLNMINLVSFVNVFVFGQFFFNVLGMDESGYAWTKLC